MDLRLPSNVRVDENTGLYIITNSKGQTFRVNAQNQAQLDTYVQAVNTNTPTTITTTNPNDGTPVTTNFNPELIQTQRTQVINQQTLLTNGKRQAGVIGNADGTYTDLRTNTTITQEEAAQKIRAAGLPPETLTAITPTKSPAYTAAERSVNDGTNTPSGLPQSPEPASQQPPPAISADNTRISPTTDSSLAEGEQVAAPISLQRPVGESLAPLAAAPTVENQEPKQPFDEFAGLDEEVDRQQQLNAIAQANRTPEDIDLENERVAAFEEESRLQAQIDYENAPPVTNEDFGGTTFGLQTDENQSAAETARLSRPPESNNTASSVDAARTGGVNSVQRNIRQQEDWRVRLSLAPSATYLYNAAKEGDVLYPLKGTSGVIFPYTPTINVNYRANYDPSDITHSNYKYYFYKNSSVDDISITAEFTAQDTTEANYLLAVIHFFKSVTKMFYGQDKNPAAGTPPPLCYLFGYGQYQFSDHPLLISNFQYNLPNDVDYIRAGSTTQWAGQNVAAYRTPANNTNQGGILGFLKNTRLGRIPQGAISGPPNFSGLSNSQATYVPTKLSITITALPVVTRRETATLFSLENYAKGDLLKKGFW